MRVQRVTAFFEAQKAEAQQAVARAFDAQLERLRRKADTAEDRMRAIFPSTDLAVRTFILAHDLQVRVRLGLRQGPESSAGTHVLTPVALVAHPHTRCSCQARGLLKCCIRRMSARGVFPEVAESGAFDCELLNDDSVRKVVSPFAKPRPHTHTHGRAVEPHRPHRCGR